jgi:glycosyltransferase involved in cell wall biosynthesis
MKIGLVIYGSLETLSGGYLYDRMLVEYLRNRGDTVEVISLPSRNYAAHLADNLRFRLPAGLDLVVEDELNHASLLGANRRLHAAAPGGGYPVVSLVHHLRSSEQRPAWQNLLYRQIERRYLQSVDGFIFNSQTTRDVVHALTGEGKPHVVAYPPTDRLGDGLPAELVRSRAGEPAPLRIVFLGSLIPRKGLHTLLDALRQLQPGLWTLDVVGPLTADPAYAGVMQEKVEVSGLTASVNFRGPLESEALSEQLAHSQVLAVPSSYEGFGIVYLEGMAFGLPAIGSLTGAAAEIITDGADGYLVPPDDPAILAARLSTLASDRPLLERLSLNALARYRRQPKWEQTAARVRDFLETMIPRQEESAIPTRPPAGPVV